MKVKVHFNTEDNTLVIETNEQVIPVLKTETPSTVINKNTTNRKDLISLTKTANQLHCNVNDMVNRLISEDILFRDSRERLQATNYGIDNGWVVSYPFSKGNYSGTYAKVTTKGIKYISDLMK